MEANAVAAIRKQAGLTQQELADRSGVAQPNIAAYERGTRNPSATMLERLETAARPKPSVLLAKYRLDVMRIAALHHAGDVRVFGSIARGEDRSGSDVDLLVRFDATASVYDQVELAEDLEDLLGVRVDVVSEGGLGERHESIRRDARAV